MRKIIYILVAFLLFSCSTKKIFTEKNTLVKKDSLVSKTKQKDSISVIRKEIITPAVSASLVLNNPCDSVGGLKKNSLSTSIGKLKLNITTDPITKKIFIQANYDSIKSVFESKFANRIKSDSLFYAKSLKEAREKSAIITRYRMGFIGWFSIVLNALLIILLFKIK